MSNRSQAQRFRVHAKSDLLIREFCDLPLQCHVATGGESCETNLIAYQQNPCMNGNPER